MHQWLTDWIEDLGRERSDSTAMSTSRIVGHPEEGQVEREALSHANVRTWSRTRAPGATRLGAKLNPDAQSRSCFPLPSTGRGLISMPREPGADRMQRRVEVSSYKRGLVGALRARRRLERLGWIVIQSDGLGWLLTYPLRW